MHALIVCIIAAATVAAIVARPLGVAEWVWSALGAAIIVATGLLSGKQAADAARDGLDVYAFLFGMLALAELARVHRIFDWLSDALARAVGGRTSPLFFWWYAAAIAVTALLSNDGTIVLLTPAALALTRAARIEALPFLYAVAFVANAASFILPISNPANLVVFSPLPQLVPWLALFTAPSAAALVCTYVVLRVRYRERLRSAYAIDQQRQSLTPQQRFTAGVIAGALAVLVLAAALGWPVGYVAFALGACSVLLIGARAPGNIRTVMREGPWSIVPLVAGLFVIVRALDAAGALEVARSLLRHASAMPPVLGRLYAGAAVTVADAAINNLPAGVVARYALRAHGIAPHVAHAVLVGIDLGPNLSVSASLATLLWVMLLRRENVEIRPLQFLATGALVTVPSLILAVLALSS